MHSYIPAQVRTFALPSILYASGASAQDSRWTLQPDVALLWWPGKSRIEAEANCLFTGSNEPSHACEGYCLTQSQGYAS